MKRLTRLNALLLVAGVFTLSTPAYAFRWSATEAGVRVTAQKGGLSVVLPGGWIYDLAGTAIMASRDGLPLEELHLVTLPHKDAFKAIKRAATAGMSPEDLAEAYVANLQADTTLHDFELLSTDPSELAGRPAFRVHGRYRLSARAGDALEEFVAVGTTTDDGFVVAFLRAPAAHYFPKWLPTFDEMITTVAIAPPTRPH